MAGAFYNRPDLRHSGENTLVAFARPSPPSLPSKVFAAIPFVLFSWYLIFRPLLAYLDSPANKASVRESARSIGVTSADWENRMFLFVLLAITLLLALANRSRLDFARLRSPPIMSLGVPASYCCAQKK